MLVNHNHKILVQLMLLMPLINKINYNDNIPKLSTYGLAINWYYDWGYPS